MSSGPGFAAFAPQQARVNRLPRNPIDKCTIVSIYPREIVEVKHTIQPSYYRIPAAPKDDFSTLVVGSASWLKEMEPDAPYQEMYVGSMTLANSIITDYCQGLLGSGADRGPGVFYVPGTHTRKELKEYQNPETFEGFKSLLDRAKLRQRLWYQELVKLSDSLWARSNGNPLVITDDARLAATELGLMKDWMADFKAAELTNCKACGHMVNPMYPVCSNCKNIINPDKAKELGIQFASIA